MIRLGKKLFICSFFLCALLATFTINTSLVCNATTQGIIEEPQVTAKALSILNDVIGVTTAEYDINMESYCQESYFEVLPQEVLTYNLESEENTFSVVYSFVDKSLRSMNFYISDDSSLVNQQQVTSTTEMAQDFLTKYQTQADASYYAKLSSMLDDVETGKNVTKTFENTKLKVTITANYTSFRWTYTANGIEAPSKCVALKFERGFLKYFIDTWSLWTVNNTEINVSEEEAINLAMNAAENYSWNVSTGEDNPEIQVTEFNIVGVSETKLQIGNYATKNESRGGNPLTLYPEWHIKIYFDEFYSGQVYGLDIGIWADTGKISDIDTLKILGDYSSVENSNDNDSSISTKSNMSADAEISSKMPMIMGIVFLTAIVIGATAIWFKHKKTSNNPRNGTTKKPIHHAGALLCLLIVLTSMPLTLSASTVNADTYVMPLYAATYQVETDEKNAVQSIINVWESYFNTWTTYTIYDYYGSDTEESAILGNASSFESTYDHVAMFHYGHAGMSGVHRNYNDDEGWLSDDDRVWDYEVWDETGSSKHFFVLIWSCRQGDYIGGYTYLYGRYGMPYCWFHGNPTAADCFIGFEDAAMPITQQSANNTSYDHELWLKQVGIRLSYSHSTVSQALDAATNQYFNCDFDESELYLGYTAYWGDWGSWTGKMKIYGNQNIQLY